MGLGTLHTHTHLTALCPGLPGWAGTRKVKPIWILLKQETVSGSWAICKSAPRSRQITMPAPHRSVFYRPDALPAAQPTVSKHWRHASGTLLRHQYLPDCPASQKIRSRAIVNKCTGKAVTVTSYPCSANVALADRQKWSCRFRDTIFCILISCGLIVNSRAAKSLVINELWVSLRWQLKVILTFTWKMAAKLGVKVMLVMQWNWEKEMC